MNFLKIKINPGEEVMEVLTQKFKELNLNEGTMNVIGAVDECCISNMSKANAKEDILTTYEEPFELSGVGEVRDGLPHIHCTLSREGDSALHGHLHWARVKTWYVSVYLTYTK